MASFLFTHPRKRQRWTGIAVFFATALLTGCARPATFPRTVAPAPSLAGTWTATGYLCNGPEPPETVRISQVGSLVKAMKLRGDACVGDNQPTWEGTYTRSPFTVRFFGPLGEAPATIRVLSATKLELRDGVSQIITFVRQP